ncbi:MAG: DNA adenine methylase [Muribaculaceae bacterium]|nr:DNA adenine methylase [Muribaculaceae bacterium]
MKDPNWIKCIINADSKDIIKRIPDNSIDFILTDPPYNLGKHSTGNISLPGRSAINNDIADWDKIDFNPAEWADEFIRILKPTGNLFIFTSYNQIGRWYDCLDHKFDTTNFMIWHKTNPAPKIFKAGFLNSCEMIFTCWNKKHTWNFSSQAEMHNFVESAICMRPERLSNPKHPSQKPVKILKKMIEIASNKEDIIFDPFMGVGSIGVASLELGRRFIGVEIDPVYCQAAKERINKTFSSIMAEQNSKIKQSPYPEVLEVNEQAEIYQPSLFDMDVFFRDEEKKVIKVNSVKNMRSGKSGILSPIIKWPGGKEKELKYIYDSLPKYERFFEPFVGGGSVFMAMNSKEYFINDFSTELINLYENISYSNNEFFLYAENIDNSWIKTYDFFKAHLELIDLYKNYREDSLTKDELKEKIKNFCNNNKETINSIIDKFQDLPSILLKEMETNLYRKMARMKELEIQKHQLPDKDLNDNIETAIKSAVYMNFRYLYNLPEIKGHNALHSALFLFIRNYAYSGMFRYSSKGEFNVPYGGIAYNRKSLKKKLDYYRSTPLLKHFGKTHIYNLDFEEFLNVSEPTEDDFVFLDPPYDSEFSTYAQNDFNRSDQERLADYMINRCRAKWMLIIKNTDFIYNLYNNQHGINIQSFDKNYTVSFMNRNDKKVKHLLITNYQC